jgi:hypothetical protein
LLLVLLEATQHGIGDLGVHLDVAFAGKGEGVRRFGGAGAGEMGVMGIMGVMRVRRVNRGGVAEQAAEDVGEEVREQGGFLEIVGTAGIDEAGPFLDSDYWTQAIGIAAQKRADLEAGSRCLKWTPRRPVDDASEDCYRFQLLAC